jgi:hypothetical protein
VNIKQTERETGKQTDNPEKHPEKPPKHFVWKQHYPQMTDNVEFIVLAVFL